MSTQDSHEAGEACLACPSRFSQLRKLGLRVGESDFVIALAGNPNTGKTTVFNALTGLRMHTGNWPGKTISRANGIEIDDRNLARDLGIPVVPCAARSGKGIPELIRETAIMAARTDAPPPRRLPLEIPGLRPALDLVEADLLEAFPNLPQPRWVALRLLEGDREIMEAVRSGEIGTLAEPVHGKLNQSA